MSINKSAKEDSAITKVSAGGINNFKDFSEPYYDWEWGGRNDPSLTFHDGEVNINFKKILTVFFCKLHLFNVLTSYGKFDG